MSHQAELQAVWAEVKKRDERIAFTDAAVKDAYNTLNEFVSQHKTDAVIVVALIRATSRLWPVLNRKW